MLDKFHTSRSCSQSRNAWPLVSSSNHMLHKSSPQSPFDGTDWPLWEWCCDTPFKQRILSYLANVTSWFFPKKICGSPHLKILPYTPLQNKKNVNLYALLTVNFPLGVYTHTSLSPSKRPLNRILRIAWASVGIKICFINSAHQSQDKGSMRALTLACAGSIFGWYRTLKVADSLSHLLA